MTPIAPRRANPAAAVEARLRELERAGMHPAPRETGSTGTPGVVLPVLQTAHGLTEGTVVMRDGTDWVAASPSAMLQGDDQVLGVVIAVQGDNSFAICVDGDVSLPTSLGLSEWTTYYLGDAGTLVTLANLAASVHNVRRAVLTTMEAGLCTVHGPHAWGGHDHAISETVTQAGHGFAAGEVVTKNADSSSWVQASIADCRVITGLVIAVPDVDTFVVALAGIVYRPSGTAQEYYYLQAAAGTLAVDPPVTTPPTNSPGIAILYQIDAHRALMLGPSAPTAAMLKNLRDVDYATSADGYVLRYVAATQTFEFTPLDFLAVDASYTVQNITDGSVTGMAMIVSAVPPGGITWQLGKVPINQGGTNGITKAEGFDNLSPQTTRGDVITHNGTNCVRLALGSAGQVLKSDGTDLVWGTAGSGVLTTRGDLLTRDASTEVRVAIGAAGRFLRSNGTDPSWQVIAAGDFPTIGSATGNARGTGAVDWQTVRAGVAQVASGNYATVIGGENNTASGTHSIAGGFANIASGNYGVALGYQNTASGSVGIAMGNGCTASSGASWSIAMGLAAVASSTAFALGTGATTTAAAGGSVAMGNGVSTTAGHTGAWTLGSAVGSNGPDTLTLGFSGIYTNGDFYRNGTKILSTQQAAVTAPTGGATVDSEARTAINAIRARLAAHGLIA
jgi:hypothetical protein